MKVLWLDTETTGTDPSAHEIHQLACLMEIDKKIVGAFEDRIRPTNMDAVSDEALEVSGTTREQLAGFAPAVVVYRKFSAWLGDYIDKYNRSDKAYPGGYNVGFDTDFVRRFFERNGDMYWGSWCNHRNLDALPLARMLDFYGMLKTENLKLATVCDAYGIELEHAHDALNDVRAARNLWYTMTRRVENAGVLARGPR